MSKVTSESLKYVGGDYKNMTDRQQKMAKVLCNNIEMSLESAQVTMRQIIHSGRGGVL